MNQHLVQRLLIEEIERAVCEARKDRRIIHAGRYAPSLMLTYPNCGMTASEVVNEIGAVAACAGVPVELSRPEVPA